MPGSLFQLMATGPLGEAYFGLEESHFDDDNFEYPHHPDCKRINYKPMSVNTPTFTYKLKQITRQNKQCAITHEEISKAECYYHCYQCLSNILVDPFMQHISERKSCPVCNAFIDITHVIICKNK